MHRRIAVLALALSSVCFSAATDRGAAAAPAASLPTFRLKPDAKALLLEIAKATPEAPYTLADRTTSEAKELIKHDLLIFNETMAQGNSVPALLSDKGKLKAQSYNPNAGTGTPRGPLPNPEDFEIEDDVPPPEPRRGAVARNVYPFDKLNVGQSFFIAPSATTDNPAKSKQSTVAAHNKRCLDAFEKARSAGDPAANAEGAVAPKFRIAESTKVIDGAEVKGARVWRIQ